MNASALATQVHRRDAAIGAALAAALCAALLATGYAAARAAHTDHPPSVDTRNDHIPSIGPASAGRMSHPGDTPGAGGAPLGRGAAR